MVQGGPGNDEIWLDSGPDRIDAGEGDDVVHANNGTWWAMVDCGPGDDTIYINPAPVRGGKRAVAAGNPNGATRSCEHAIEEAVVKDPSVGVMEKSESKAGVTLTGTDANDKLLGGPGPDRISGGAGDDVIWGHHQSRGASLGTDRIDAGPGGTTPCGATATAR